MVLSTRQSNNVCHVRLSHRRVPRCETNASAFDHSRRHSLRNVSSRNEPLTRSHCVKPAMQGACAERERGQVQRAQTRSIDKTRHILT